MLLNIIETLERWEPAGLRLMHKVIEEPCALRIWDRLHDPFLYAVQQGNYVLIRRARVRAHLRGTHRAPDRIVFARTYICRDRQSSGHLAISSLDPNFSR